MPWGSSDAQAHTKKADTAHLRALWAKVANARLEAGDSEESAIRQANAAVERQRSKGHRFI